MVESIGDMLALWEAGIKNCIVTFGLAITSKIKQVLMVIDPKKIYISFNNDENQAGIRQLEKLTTIFVVNLTCPNLKSNCLPKMILDACPKGKY